MDALVALIIIGVCVSLFRKSGVKQSRKRSAPYRRGQVNPRPVHFEPVDPVSTPKVSPSQSLTRSPSARRRKASPTRVRECPIRWNGLP